MSLATRESVSTKAYGGTRLDVVPLTKHIGAEIRGVDLRLRREPHLLQRDLKLPLIL